MFYLHKRRSRLAIPHIANCKAFKSVLLPLPDGPKTPVRRPGCTIPVIFSRIVLSPIWNFTSSRDCNKYSTYAQHAHTSKRIECKCIVPFSIVFSSWVQDIRNSGRTGDQSQLYVSKILAYMLAFEEVFMDSGTVIMTEGIQRVCVYVYVCVGNDVIFKFNFKWNWFSADESSVLF